jgi:predicted dehydrogenase
VAPQTKASANVSCTFVGAGNYGSRVLIPAFKAAGAALNTLVTSGGLSAAIQGRKAAFARASTDVDEAITHPESDVAVIVTRHDSHADLTMKALNAGKHVFVEKPLALQERDINHIESFYKDPVSAKPILMVGFNRRYSPYVVRMKELLRQVREPYVLSSIMNAGYIPREHWTQDPIIGGGRIIGEACHHIDLLRYLAGSEIVSVQARRIGNNHGIEVTEDKAAIILGFANGSMGTIQYVANGHQSFPKERVEVFGGGRVLQLNNFRELRGYGWPNFRKMRSWRQDKGQTQCVAAFLEAVRTTQGSPIPIEELLEVARVSIKVAKILREQI